MPVTKEEIDAMSPDEKHVLLDMLWESLAEENYIDDAGEETEEENQILRERLEDYTANPSSGIKWEDLKDELLNRSHD